MQLSSLLYRVIPPGIYRGKTPWPLLAALSERLHQCDTDAAAIEISEEAKSDLLKLLRARFDLLAAQALTLKIPNPLLAQNHLRRRSARVVQAVRARCGSQQRLPAGVPGCVHSARNEAS